MEALVEIRQISICSSSFLSCCSTIHVKTSHTFILFPFRYPKITPSTSRALTLRCSKVYKNRKSSRPRSRHSKPFISSWSAFPLRIAHFVIIIALASSLQLRLQTHHLANRKHRAIAHEIDRAHLIIMLAFVLLKTSGRLLNLLAN